ncbi:hypothetical protein OAH77_04405 [Flavobacteriaceae bacterium]|nr:hypothetical protein [Flavobacteriaceae bacterium]
MKSKIAITVLSILLAGQSYFCYQFYNYGKEASQHIEDLHKIITQKNETIREVEEVEEEIETCPVEIVGYKTGFRTTLQNGFKYCEPHLQLTVENTSGKDINNIVKIKVIFIQENIGEQIRESDKNICSSSRPFLAGLKKTVRFRSNELYMKLGTGMVAAIYLEGKLYKKVPIAAKYLFHN